METDTLYLEFFMFGQTHNGQMLEMYKAQLAQQALQAQLELQEQTELTDQMEQQDQLA
jgi:hypothetical protein